MQPTPSWEDILDGLNAQARLLWGDRRAEALRASLEATARHLNEIGRNLPRVDTESGLYQPLHK